jgi:hypothetical protein
MSGVYIHSPYTPSRRLQGQLYVGKYNTICISNTYCCELLG